MKLAFVVEIVTPRKYVLRGLWFGPRKPQRAIVWIHGLGGSAFSMRRVIDETVNKETAVLAFNNRGFGVINKISSASKKGKSLAAGSAKECFADCADDIRGALNFVKRQGVKDIFLVGHSTGCQKSVFWASRTKGGGGVKGIILLAPVSDWASEIKRKGKAKIARAANAARALIRRGKKHSLLPEGLWHEVLDAQRFLSLYTPESTEEIFSYAQPGRNPRTLRRVKVPVLTIWAERDEYRDRPTRMIKDWFVSHAQNPRSAFISITGAAHGFRRKEQVVARTLRDWMRRVCRSGVRLE